ncbi:signal recognition particle 9 kDa protein-domain-containing protein [Halenospora varia]|nr:signal recognition particle 9 kDa protein-domain-containing protein [Halenospora varia]
MLNFLPHMHFLPPSRTSHNFPTTTPTPTPIPPYDTTSPQRLRTLNTLSRSHHPPRPASAQTAKMPYLETAQQWLTQSTLLLQARPSTTRITTKYTIPNPSTLSKRAAKSKPRPSHPSTTQDPNQPAQIQATLTLKTYDPASGTTLKYSTNKAAEVGRLIQILGRLARPMAGLAVVKEEDVVMGGGGGEVGSGVATPVVKEEEKVLSGPGAQGKAPVGGGGGGKGKKKKGKK